MIQLAPPLRVASETEIHCALDQRQHLAVPLIVLRQIHQCHGKPELGRLL